jgi:DNA-binding transcriptional MerR regulator
MQLQVRLPVCLHILLNSGILPPNIQAEHQVRIITLLRAVQTSVKKITELVNKGPFSNQSVTLSMRRQKQNSGRRSERRLTLQSAAAECQILRNF